MLNGFDEEGRKFIQNIYQEKGITLHSETSPTKLTKGEDGKITLRAEKKSGEEIMLDGIDQVRISSGISEECDSILAHSQTSILSPTFGKTHQSHTYHNQEWCVAVGPIKLRS